LIKRVKLIKEAYNKRKYVKRRFSKRVTLKFINFKV